MFSLKLLAIFGYGLLQQWYDFSIVVFQFIRNYNKNQISLDSLDSQNNEE